MLAFTSFLIISLQNISDCLKVTLSSSPDAPFVLAQYKTKIVTMEWQGLSSSENTLALISLSRCIL